MRHLLLPLSIVLTLARASQAHIALRSPAPRSSALKEGPCGGGTADPRSTNPTRFTAGETITVTWKETIGHPGHYRIAFDPNGDALFTDPSSFTDVAPRPGVLKDNIADKSGTQIYTEQVTLPDVECNNCTLQVIQVMTDKPPYGDGNDNYYQCADLILTRAPSATDAGTSSDAGAVVSAGDAGATSGNGDAAAAGPRSLDEGTDAGCSARPNLGSYFGAGGLLFSAFLLRASRRGRLLVKP